jgi:peptide/nickel transport system permease protein
MADVVDVSAVTNAGASALSPSRGRLLERVRTDRVLAVALGILAVYAIVALIAPLVAPNPNIQVLTSTLQSPSGAHLLGTDEYGRDVLSRLLHAIRSSMQVGIVVAIGSGIGGLVLGMAAGYLGGAVDAVISRIVDVGLAFPTLVLALGLITALGVGLQSTQLALIIGFVPFYTRVMRAAVLRIRQEAYVESARVTGVPSLRIVLRHIVPNLLGPIMVQETMVFAFALLGEASLSFVGLGIQSPTASLGNMIAGAQAHALQAPWLTIAPGLAAAVLIMTLLFIGDALRDAADPLTVR